MTQPSIPYARLRFFRDELDLTPEALAPLEPYREVFIAHQAEMADFLFERIAKIAQTKIVLEHETNPQRLRSNWRGWYKAMWSHPLDDDFLAALWRSGTGHVSHGVDHRFINLAYSHVRRYTHRLISQNVGEAERDRVHEAVDRLFDLCILVETDAYLAANTQCSNEVMMGIAHQIRNPLTVIGGFAQRLQRSSQPGSSTSSASATILDEAMRLERMVKNVGAHIDILQREPTFSTVPLAEIIEDALERLRAEGCGPDVQIEVNLDHPQLQADRAMLESMFYHLLQNSMEAAEAAGDHGERQELRIWTDPAAAKNFVAVRIYNTGELDENLDVEELFLPFHSTKPYGTGFGLAIARLAARKNFGTVTLDRFDHGVLCQVTLPLSGAVHESGLFYKQADASGFLEEELNLPGAGPDPAGPEQAP